MAEPGGSTLAAAVGALTVMGVAAGPVAFAAAPLVIGAAAGAAAAFLSSASGPFVEDLQELRTRAGKPSYREMAKRVDRSPVALAQVGIGRVAEWEDVAAFVSACGDNPESWRARWEQARTSDAPSAPGPSAIAPVAKDVADDTGAGAIGPSGRRVGERLAELRRARGLTLADLEDRLTELGRPIVLSALSKIENGQRRVDVDDLVALAAALGVGPNMALLPDDARHDHIVDLTPTQAVSAAQAWAWALHDRPSGPAGLAASPENADFDFFISYASPDADWAEWIAWHLETAGWRTFSQRDLVIGDNWRVVLKDALGRSARVLAVLSPAYLDSAYVAEEWGAAWSSDPDGAARRLTPVAVSWADFPEPFDHIVRINLFDLEEDEAARQLVDSLRRNLAGKVRPDRTPSFPKRDRPRPEERPLPEIPNPGSTDR